LVGVGAETVRRTTVSTRISDTIVPKMAIAARSNARWETGELSAGTTDAGVIGSSAIGLKGRPGDAGAHAGTNRVIGRQGVSPGGWQDEASRRHLGRGGGRAQQERKDGNRDGGGDSAEHAPAYQSTNQAGHGPRCSSVFLSTGKRLIATIPRVQSAARPATLARRRQTASVACL
jgi:hypothetical protein